MPPVRKIEQERQYDYGEQHSSQIRHLEPVRSEGKELREKHP